PFHSQQAAAHKLMRKNLVSQVNSLCDVVNILPTVSEKPFTRRCYSSCLSAQSVMIVESCLLTALTHHSSLIPFLYSKYYLFHLPGRPLQYTCTCAEA